ncbi:MAG: cupin domain-containing protein [Pseudomonadota bacterium]
MRLSRVALGIAAFATCASAAFAQAIKPDPSHITFTLPKDIAWKTGEAMDQAVIFGDPAKPGIYGLLLRWKAGHFSHPHFHNTDRFVHVLSGTWWVSDSDTYDPSKTYPMPAGSIVTDLANKVHYDGAKNEDALLELVGMGPVTTTPAEAGK